MKDEIRKQLDAIKVNIAKIETLLEDKPAPNVGGSVGRRMQVSPHGVDELKRHEGVRQRPYRDAVGLWTVGVGHLIGDGRSLPAEWNRKLSMDEVDALLRHDLERFERCVEGACPDGLTQNRFDAMVSLCFNIGERAFKRSSICRRHNAGDYQGAANAFRLYRKAGGRVLYGLVQRRERERALYLS